MNKATLVGLMMMALGSGCAREAVVAASPAAPAPVSSEARLDALADPNEEHCMTVAERAYYDAAGYEMSSLGDAPVPDAAYEDAYAACTEGR